LSGQKIEVERQIENAFRNSDVFKGLNQEEIEEIGFRFHPQDYTDGDFLFHEGDEASTYYLIIQGRVKVLQTSAEGINVILHILDPGELIGALPTLGKGTYPATATALGQTECQVITSQDFEDIMRQNPQVAINLLRFAAGKLQASHGRIREMTTERVERRIARTLGRLAFQVGKKQDEGVLLDIPLSRQDLAEMTGTTIYTVSRTIKEWERESILRASRKQIVLLDLHALALIGEDLPESKSYPPSGMYTVEYQPIGCINCWSNSRMQDRT
jgi:CRP-like cAMP-binding protein